MSDADIEIEVRKILCCPLGCCRDDDCFVDGQKHRFINSRRELEQAKAILARFELIPRINQQLPRSP